jgi:hypothetical protein
MAWQTLGTIVPVIDQWREYAPSSQEVTNPIEGTIYRLEPQNLEAGEQYKTYALVRFRYDDGEKESFTRAFRIYPYPGAIIQVVPIPPAISIFPFSWIPQIRKIVYPRFRGRSAESPWGVKIEDYIAPPASIGESLEQAITDLVQLARYSY